MRIQCEMYILPTPSERAIIFYYLCTVYKQLKKHNYANKI
jgi:hypothetical protein